MDKKLEDSKMVLRGGSWDSNHKMFVRGSIRIRSSLTAIIYLMPLCAIYGFRCCKPASCLKQVERWKDETEGGLFDG